MSIRIYEFGLLQPTANQEVAIEQLRYANQYYNDLIEIEMNRRKAYSFVLNETCDGRLDVLQGKETIACERQSTLRQEIKMLKGKKDTESVATRLRLKAEMREMNPIIEALKASLKEEKKLLSANAEFQQKNVEISARALVLAKATRERSKGYWGTRGGIDASVQQAKKAKRMKFRRFSGEGSLIVQLQKDNEGNNAVPFEKIFGESDNRVQVLPLSMGKAKHLLRLRVTSTADKKPVWGEWPMILHRDFPEGSKIRFVKVLRRRMATWFRWYVQFTVEVPDVLKKDLTSKLAVDLGWRSNGDGSLRVAYLGDDKGSTLEIQVPARIRSGFDKADSIRGIRDKLLDELRASLLAAFTSDVTQLLPSELQGKISYLSAWKATRRFVRLRADLKKVDEVGLGAIKAVLDVWYQRYRHLWQYESNLRDKTCRARREIFRLHACALAKKYSVLILEDFKLTEVIEAPKPEDEVESTDKQKEIAKKVATQRFQASPGLLRNCLVNAFEREGGTVVKVEARGTTRTCYLCGYDKPWKNKAEKMHTCGGCGARWDRDDNAYRNILKRGEVMIAVGLEPKKKRANAFAKRHERLAEAAKLREPKPLKKARGSAVSKRQESLANV